MDFPLLETQFQHGERVGTFSKGFFGEHNAFYGDLNGLFHLPQGFPVVPVHSQFGIMLNDWQFCCDWCKWMIHNGFCLVKIVNVR